MQVIEWRVGSDDTVAQSYTSTENQDIYALVPHLIVRGAPGGNVYLQLQDSSGGKIADSEAISIATIADSNEVFHGKYRFLLSASLRRNTTYRIEMKTSGGYTFGEDDYVGWCNEWERKNAFDSSYSPSGGFYAALAIDVWAYKYLKKGEF